MVLSSATHVGQRPEKQRKRMTRNPKLQVDYVLTRNIPLSDIRKLRAVWDVVFDSDHRPVLLPPTCVYSYFTTVFNALHRSRLPNALREDGTPAKFVRLLGDMNQRTTAAVRTPVGSTTLFEVVTRVRQMALGGPFLFNFAIDDIMRRTIDQCPADIVLASPSIRVSLDLS
ncbi:hypothetical protein RB195_006313 [Necator americanus]|uniref:Uncharacterized protein n=1 Tax=Necator americanus TaxID=51031 RepID=A0ABR1BVH5_NECAM